MTAHTPGPWWLEDSGQDGLTVYGKSKDAATLVVCSRMFHPYRKGEMLANLSLIAAAPELLEALERIARPHDCGCKPCTGACRNQLALEITAEEIQELARAAIAKAKGESDGR